MTRLVNFLKNDDGQDLLEYALLVALIAIVAVGAVTAAGNTVNGIFTQIAGAIRAGLFFPSGRTGTPNAP